MFYFRKYSEKRHGRSSSRTCPRFRYINILCFCLLFSLFQSPDLIPFQSRNMTDLGLPGGVNPLDFLHKLATQRGLPRPDFVQVGEQGLPHNKVFVWQCSFYQVVAQGSGRSKKEAKVAAARAVRDQLNFNELPPPPTFQSQMERKLKRRMNSNGSCGDFANGAESSAKVQKYDYSLHFQCYR